jgi:hypothetical protein
VLFWVSFGYKSGSNYGAIQHADGLITNFDDHVAISVGPETGPPKIFSKSEYKTYASKAFSLPSSYELSKLANSLELSSDGSKAIAKTLIYEHATFGSITSYNLSNQITTIELRNGAPTITSVVAKTLLSNTYWNKSILQLTPVAKYVAINQ